MRLRVAVLVKQVPRFENLALGLDGRLRREGVELELNPYCRRAVAKGVEIAAQTGGLCTVLTLGPPSAEDCLREAIAWGADTGILITDPLFAGSDTLATARALAAAVRREGPFDLLLAGRASVDADTGQVGPELAELLDLPFLPGVRDLRLDHREVSVECELDDGWLWAEVGLPVVMTCAERLCDPAKVEPDRRALVSPDRIRRLDAEDLGPGPWGLAGSPTRVGEVKIVDVDRNRVIAAGTRHEQVGIAVGLLQEAGAFARSVLKPTDCVPDGWERTRRSIAVLAEPGRDGATRELLGAAARLASSSGATVYGLGTGISDVAALGRWGADEAVRLDGVSVAEDVADTFAGWCRERVPWAVLAPSTTWGREVASRVAASSGSGLTGDAIDVDIDCDRLVGWKPAFGGQMVVGVTAISSIQMATVRPGVLPCLSERGTRTVPVTTISGQRASRIRYIDAVRDDDVGRLSVARVVIGVGAGVPPEDYGALDPLLEQLGAELGATRRVTDKHWLPHAKQIGITGRSISPVLYVAIGISGKFNHMVGVRTAGMILAINSDASAPVFDQCDIGIIGDWREVLPLLVRELDVRGVDVRARA